MARTYMLRGMLCGIAAGLLVFVYARLFGEPSVEGAIAVEEHLEALAGEPPEPEMVSRAVQAGWGLFTGTMLFSVAMGGLFALAFAFALGRVGRLGERATAGLLAAAAFVTVYLVPFVKYPANPPSIGNPDTIGERTLLYFAMILVSVVGAVAALNLGRALSARLGTWRATLAALGLYLGIVVIAGALLPPVDEVPAAFPASLLWAFRLAAVGVQLVLWASLGLLFGELTARRIAPRTEGGARLRRAG